jgi:hypothetical protein
MDQTDDQKYDSTSCLEEPEIINNQQSQDNRKMDESSEEPNAPEKSADAQPSKKSPYEEFLNELEKQGAPEQKISHVLQFMENAISQSGSPSFKNFWDARKLCLTFFKEENLSFSVRSHLWSRYVELSKEAHRLKEVLDEQSAFAAEQIDLAIKALESDIENLGESGVQAPEAVFDSASKFLEPKIGEYQKVQKELSLLNAFAAKVNSLRKELIKTEMRIRFKNNFFQRLSIAGDKVFPRRKELIKSVSQMFIEDVNRFIDENFSFPKIKQPFYFLREEIKALQSVAKALTLNTQAFNQTRMKLSECWDKIKKIEKEKKKEKAKLKAAFQEEANKVQEKINDLESQYKEGGLSDAQAFSQIQEISQFMRQVQLGRDDVNNFRDRLSRIRADVNDKATAAEKERLRREKEQEDQIIQQALRAIEAVKTLISEVETRSFDEINNEIEKLNQEMSQLKVSKSLQNDFERQLQVLNDRISEQRIRNLPKDDQEAYEQLQVYLQESKNRRSEIKSKLESYRKASGVSGLDIEQALKQKELVEYEKERLEKVDEEIDHIQEKINDLQQNS